MEVRARLRWTGILAGFCLVLALAAPAAGAQIGVAIALGESPELPAPEQVLLSMDGLATPIASAEIDRAAGVRKASVFIYLVFEPGEDASVFDAGFDYANPSVLMDLPELALARVVSGVEPLGVGTWEQCDANTNPAQVQTRVSCSSENIGGTRLVAELPLMFIADGDFAIELADTLLARDVDAGGIEDVPLDTMRFQTLASFDVVPEPSTLLLALGGLAGLGAFGRSR